MTLLPASLPSEPTLLLVLAVGVLIAAIAAAAGHRFALRRIEARTREFEAQARRIAGGEFAVLAPVQNAGSLGRLGRALNEMSEALAEREKAIQSVALRDPITGRPNRAGFLQAIAPHLAADRAAVLAVGLVRASDVVNTVGREIAGRVLRHVALRLSRLLGDEPLGCLNDRTLAVFLRQAGELKARTVAASIIEHCEVPYAEGDLTIDAVVAVGVALMPLHGTSGRELLHHAEVALSVALKNDSNWAVYDPAADPYRPERLSLMSDLRRGLLSDEFTLFYQPKLHIPSAQLTAAEALVRWHHPRRGILPTSEFVELAEETGNIRHLTRWALRTAISQAAAWRDDGIDLRIAINLSARDLSDTRLPDAISRLLAEHELDPRAISLEVTESAMLADPARAIDVLRSFAERKFHVALDDFGAGQTSLQYLRSLPVHELKIDKAFVRNLIEDGDDRKIIRSVIELGHGLGFAVTVEGVEDAATLEILAGLGCDYAQGFHIARPLIARMLIPFLRHYPQGFPAVGADP